MSVCANRDDEPGLLMSCTADLGNQRVGCLCRVQVEEDVKRAETRVARVPDSAREETP